MSVTRKAIGAKPSVGQSSARRATPDFTVTYFLSRADTVALIKRGIYADDIRKMACYMGVTRKQIAIMLAVSAAVVATGAGRRQLLTPVHAHRLVGLGKLVGQLQAIVAHSGGSDNFDAMHWLAQWLFRPNAALGWTAPAAHMSTLKGQQQLSDLLALSESGTVS
jgi:hypothetical protein